MRGKNIASYRALAMRLIRVVFACVLLVVTCAACSGSEDKRPGSVAQSDVPSAAPTAKPEIVTGATPVAPFVAEAILSAPAAKTIVYVGATWCEPCQRFHAALQSGALDAQLPGVRFIEYDLDRSKAELADAGYVSRLIPLFALPEADGRCSARKLEGSIKGETAVQSNILPRLATLLH